MSGYTVHEYDFGSWVLYRDDTEIAWFDTESDAVLAAELFNGHETGHSVRVSCQEHANQAEPDSEPLHANQAQTARELHVLDENPPSELP